jgi:hypothetical protein
VEVGFEGRTVKGIAPISDEEKVATGILLRACDLRLLRLRLKKNRARRSKMSTSPPITPPMIALVVLLRIEVAPLVVDGDVAGLAVVITVMDASCATVTTVEIVDPIPVATGAEALGEAAELTAEVADATTEVLDTIITEVTEVVGTT